MRYAKYSEEVKADLKLSFLELNNRKASAMELRFLLSNLWLIAKGEAIDILFLTPEEEAKFIPTDATEEEIESNLLSYENELKRNYSSELSNLKELIVKYNTLK